MFTTMPFSQSFPEHAFCAHGGLCFAAIDILNNRDGSVESAGLEWSFLTTYVGYILFVQMYGHETLLSSGLI
jgi:hypothetical protein